MRFQELEPYLGMTIRMKYSYKMIDFGKKVRVVNNLTGVIVELHRTYIVFQVLHSGREIFIKPKDVININSMI